MAHPSLSIGIVGCGRMGRHHALTCQGIGHRIAFLYDAEPERAAALAPECAHAEIVAAPDDIASIAVDSGQCVALLRALRGRSVVHLVGYMSRYRASVRRARQAVTGRDIVGLAEHWARRKIPQAVVAQERAVRRPVQ